MGTAVRVRGRDPSGRSRRYVRMWGLPHSDEPDEWMSGELWVGVTLSGWSPVAWAPMKWSSEGSEAKGRVHINPHKTPMKPRPLDLPGRA